VVRSSAQSCSNGRQLWRLARAVPPCQSWLSVLDRWTVLAAADALDKVGNKAARHHIAAAKVHLCQPHMRAPYILAAGGRLLSAVQRPPEAGCRAHDSTTSWLAAASTEPVLQLSAQPPRPDFRLS